ncbi:hypothetical protein BU15DRAFT_82600 [Melanogaster broomeanus]|nr:hypothetical protein BU15DRAFT_82600 [Melanogaster broomeanus]
MMTPIPVRRLIPQQTTQRIQKIVVLTPQRASGPRHEASQVDSTSSTLRIIKVFTDPDSECVATQARVGDGVLLVSCTDGLRRPVHYFWSVQDFVKGLVGALRGHQFLAQSGILHHDINENNIALARRPGGERGFLIDLDTAVSYEYPWTPAQVDTQWKSYHSSRLASHPFHSQRTGTAPYISISVLDNDHWNSHFDDIESFVYVLMLFFVSYKGPLSARELLAADERCFTSMVTVNRSSHVNSWSSVFRSWTLKKGVTRAAGSKSLLMTAKAKHMVTDPFYSVVAEHWEKDLLPMIQDLVDSCLTFFHAAARRHYWGHHQQFIDALDAWLEKYPVPREGHNNCPFDDPETKQQAV